MTTPAKAPPRPRRADLEVRSTADLHRFCTEWHQVYRQQAYVAELVGHELYSLLSRAKGLEKFAMRLKAARVRRRLLRIAALQEAAATETTRVWATYLREFADLVSPGKQQNTWRFTDGQQRANRN